MFVHYVLGLGFDPYAMATKHSLDTIFTFKRPHSSFLKANIIFETQPEYLLWYKMMLFS